MRSPCARQAGRYLIWPSIFWYATGTSVASQFFIGHLWLFNLELWKSLRPNLDVQYDLISNSTLCLATLPFRSVKATILSLRIIENLILLTTLSFCSQSLRCSAGPGKNYQPIIQFSGF